MYAAHAGAIAVAENEYELRHDETGYISSPYRLIQPTAELELPIGVVVDDVNHRDAQVTHMTGAEEDMLGNPKTKDPMMRVIAACTTRLGGLDIPYENRTPEQRQEMLAMVNRLTIADMTFLLLAIRRCSFVDGDVYRFHITCPSRACTNRQSVHSVDLSQLTIRPAPSNQRRQFEFKLPISKRTVRYQMLLATDVTRLLTLQRQHPDSASSVQLYARIIDVDGQKLGSYDDLKRWSSADRSALLASMTDNNKFGVDLRVEVDECRTCGTTLEVEIDIKPSFFRPTLVPSK